MIAEFYESLAADLERARLRVRQLGPDNVSARMVEYHLRQAWKYANETAGQVRGAAAPASSTAPAAEGGSTDGR